MFFQETNYFMNLFQYIYNNAKLARVFEAETTYTADKLYNIYKKQQLDALPNYIHDFGVQFNSYANELYTNKEGKDISQEKFVLEVYTILKENGIPENSILDSIFYYLLPAEKKFKIPHNYQVIKYKVKRKNKADLEKIFPLSRHFALELFLKDLIESNKSGYGTLITKKFDKVILWIIKENKVLDSSNKLHLKLLNALKKHY